MIFEEILYQKICSIPEFKMLQDENKFDFKIILCKQIEAIKIILLVFDFDSRDIEEEVIGVLSGTFFTFDKEGSFCITWKSTNRTESNNMKMLFEVVYFPTQVSLETDLVEVVNTWTKKYFGQATILGSDLVQDIWKPIIDNPAIYWRYKKLKMQRVDHGLSWVEGTLIGHVIAPTCSEKNKWIKAITEQIALQDEFSMSDNSPMFVQEISARNNHNALKKGQINLVVKYGILQKKENALKLKNFYANMEGVLFDDKKSEQ